MWARVRTVLSRVGRWVLSPAGRTVWVRLLAFGVSVPLAPYAVAVWRVALYGQGAEQCLLFVAVAGVLLFRDGRRRLRAIRAGHGAPDDRPAGDGQDPRPSPRKRGRRR